ncbi:MAG: prolipoprotein diacylglyceryl transferase [Candidatus Buchananbacteria bacterium]
MISWLHHYSPERIIFSLGPINFYWYGLILVLAILAGLAVVIKFGKKINLKLEQILDLAFYLVLGGLVGARIWEVLLVNPGYYLNQPLEIFKIWQGGLAIHGALVAGLITVVVYCKKQQLNFWLTADVLVLGVTLGQAIGRWGNYFNQELFGYPTNLPWGIFIAPANRPELFLDFKYFQPTFLYESLGSLIILGLLIWQFKKIQRPGLILAEYLMLYSALRFSLEFIRLDPEMVWWGLRLPQWISLLVIMAVSSWLLGVKRSGIIKAE